MSKLGKTVKVLTIVPVLWDAGVWVADRIRARRARKYTETEREQALSDARERAEEIQKKWREDPK